MNIFSDRAGPAAQAGRFVILRSGIPLAVALLRSATSRIPEAFRKVADSLQPIQPISVIHPSCYWISRQNGKWLPRETEDEEARQSTLRSAWHRALKKLPPMFAKDVGDDGEEYAFRCDGEFPEWHQS